MKVQLKLTLTKELENLLVDHLDGELRRGGLACDWVKVGTDFNNPTLIRVYGHLQRPGLALDDLIKFAKEIEAARTYVVGDEIQFFDVPLGALGIELAVKE